jgi:guanylate kinase
MPDQKNNLIVFTGPSGVGKGTIVKKLFQEIDGIKFSVSVTTREKRDTELEGVNYFFRTKDEFERMIADNQLLEWAEFVGNYYGTPRKFVEETLAAGKDVFLEIEVQGALQIMQKFPEAITIFLMPPSFEELENRLRTRGTEDEATLQRRLKKAQEEMTKVGQFKYQLINDTVDTAVEKLKNIILGERKLCVKPSSDLAL